MTEMIMRCGLTHYIGGCYECGKEWGTRNVVGLAAKHAKQTGHETWAETGYGYSWKKKEKTHE